MFTVTKHLLFVTVNGRIDVKHINLVRKLFKPYYHA